MNEKLFRTISFIKSAFVISLLILLSAGISAAGYFVYQKAVWNFQANKIQNDLFDGLTKQEMELLLEDANPAMLKRLKEDPELKKQQIESIRQLFALAKQAVKDGLANDENITEAVKVIDAMIWAQNYDREINKDKSESFSAISQNQVKSFYGEGGNQTAGQNQRVKEFEEAYKVQAGLARRTGSIPAETEPTDEERAQFKDQFAKIKIYEAEARAKVKSGALPEKFERKVKLQSKLQQAQLLSRLYSQEVLAKKTEVTDDEIQKHLAEHPELNTAETKRAKAIEVLKRLKKGENFVKLAKEFSEDPSSRDQGGLYENLTEGSFEKEFESAALALQPGQIAPEPVQTRLGYHIIRLERKSQTKDSSGQIKQKYSVRHILFSTMIKDPENPTEREMPVREYVKSKLEKEKEKKLLDKIVADNPVFIAEDFQIPDVSDEEIRKSLPQQTPNMQSNTNQRSNTR